jgi:hypothetical protein
MLTNGILITEWRAAHALLATAFAVALSVALLGGWALWLGWWL